MTGFVKHFPKVYADRELEAETGDTEIRKPKTPIPLLPHSYASASIVTDVLIKKYVDAMPLYRQEQMWKRMGINLQRGTMANWVMLVSDTYLSLFWKRLKQELLSQSVIHADETVLQVLKEDNRPASHGSVPAPPVRPTILLYSCYHRIAFAAICKCFCRINPVSRLRLFVNVCYTELLTY